jgi:hypothetical protein
LRSAASPLRFRIDPRGRERARFRLSNRIVLYMRRSTLNHLVPHYRLTTGATVRLDAVWTHFFEGATQPVTPGVAQTFQLPTGSVLIVRPSCDPERVFVEIRCRFPLLDNGVDLASAEDFTMFCAAQGSAIRVARNGTTIPASIGAVISDIKWSRAFRRALHLACHPHDYPAQRRFAAEVGGQQ